MAIHLSNCPLPIAVHLFGRVAGRWSTASLSSSQERRLARKKRSQRTHTPLGDLVDHIDHPNETAFIGRDTAGIKVWHRMAVAWANAAAQRHGGSPMVVLPSKGSLEKDLRLLLPRHFRIESSKTLLNATREPVVVAANTGRIALQRIVDQQPKALLILPWAGIEEVMPALIARQAHDLLGEVSIPSIEEATSGNLVADEALRGLSVFGNRRFLDSRDKPKLVWAFRHLFNAGCLPDRSSVECMAGALGWSLEGANELGEYVEKVQKREAIQAGRDPLPAGIIEVWRKAAGKR